MRKNPLSNMSAHGGIITSEFLENIRSEKVVNPRIQPDSFVTSSVAAPKDKRELEQQIVDSWDRLRERWDAISSRYLKMNLSDSRSKWMIPLFRELGFDPIFNREDIIVDGDQKLRFKLSHKGWNSSVAPMVHMVLPSQDLEEESHEQGDETSRRGRNRSPHDELQTFLNVNRRCKWGIVTNGILLRILREYFHTTTKGYVEFDVENIFRERSFTDFRALYRMAHASRFLLDKEGLCHLEQFYKESVAAGVSVGENLRRNVKKAIEALGNGFVTPDSAKRMIDDEEFCRAYYSELLRVVYRLLFLLFAEQRAMLPTRDSLYTEEYSITRLREMAETRKGKDEHHDLWEGLKVTFHMLKNGSPPLRVFGYNGILFDDSEIPILSGLTCKNGDILAAIHHLTLVEEEKVLKRINYLDLGVEEIGSIYESLLDYLPKVFASEQEIEGEKVSPNTFFLDPRGAGRKTTGSYYTHPRLIDELIKSALKPVVEKKLANASGKEKTLLSVKVCDPACGSGAFLIAANNYLARELASLRTGQTAPSDREIKKATRDVLQHCIYGVDLNPMAVELAKVSLWINSCVQDMPLNFLDHHIKCGNSLIGTTPELLDVGIPDQAYAPIEGDEEDFAKKITIRNSVEKSQKLITEFKLSDQTEQAKGYALLDELNEKSTADVEEKKRTYHELTKSPTWLLQKFVADALTAAFFWPLQKNGPNPPTQATLRSIQKNGRQAVDSRTAETIGNLAEQGRFFHWYIEFPEIFQEEKEGFDCVLGNPPWEKLQVEDKQFFQTIRPDIADLSGVARKKKIVALTTDDPVLYKKWMKHCRDIRSKDKFIRSSKRFPLSGTGKFNAYSLFLEHARHIVNESGGVGMIIQSGLATDDNTKDLFSNLVKNNELTSLYDFVNSRGLFPGVHRMFKFSLVTLSSPTSQPRSIDLAFFLDRIDQLNEPHRHFQLTFDELRLLNPNTITCPTFRNKKDADMVKKIYTRIPIFIDESKNKNPWSAVIWRMFNETDDSYLFRTAKQLELNGYSKNPVGHFSKDDDIYVRFYEAKMINQYDHRFGTFESLTEEDIRDGKCKSLTINELNDPSVLAVPRYWIPRKEFEKMINDKTVRQWLVSFRNITNAGNERTVIVTITPREASGTLAPQIFVNTFNAKLVACLIANFNSLVLDFVARQKVGGTHLNHFILRQLSILQPSIYEENNSLLISLIVPRVLELVYVANDLEAFANDCEHYGPPFKWDEERRRQLKSELDAIYFYLYGISREDVDHILETFPILKRKEIEIYGEYRYKDMVLQNFDLFARKLHAPKVDVD